MKQLSKRIHYDIVLCQLMPYNGVQALEIFINVPILKSKLNMVLISVLTKELFFSAYFHNLFYQICLAQLGDIELNPGPTKTFKPLTCCHWNVNSLAAHKMLKNHQLRLITVFTIIHTSYVLARPIKILL